MEYRFERARGARRAVPVAIAAAVLAGSGFFVLAGMGPPRTSAVFRARTIQPAESPALVPLPGRSTPGTAATTTTAATTPPVTTTATPPTVAAAPTTASAVPATTPATSVAAPTTASAVTVPGGTLPEEPTGPIEPPSDPHATEELLKLGSVAIPKLGVAEPLYEGILLSTLDEGPGHWPGSAMPGEVGNVVVAAHRTSHGGPFRHIDQLVAGDTVEFTTTDGVSLYTVTETRIVEPEDVWIVAPTKTPTATLFACHPPGSVSERIVVHLELAS